MEHPPEDALLRLDVGRSDHLAPLLGFVGDQPAKVGVASRLTVAYRWAENKIDRVPELAAELVRRHHPSIVAEQLQLAAEMTRADAGLHADKARRQIGEPCLHLSALPFLSQHDRTAPIMAHDTSSCRYRCRSRRLRC